MVTRNVWLMGGPPWRLRFAPFPNRRIRITQIFPNGRANQEGMRDGDMVETISRQHCTSYKMLNAKVSES
ncbi:unnamed protein product [Cercopithifilaria johnstoni]|uniref:PDZ domain-containing protein n=1 Tax=Cercopithifilaria johnstoni TaxID=2874296 RepID=A0A8J2M335_9BILA|nr:unnamed protein product [Cercopithifilaria johnstoni]